MIRYGNTPAVGVKSINVSASNDPLVLTVLSTAYNLVGQVALGLIAVEKALTLDPDSAWAWLRSGWSNIYMRRYDTALEHFQAGHASQSARPDALQCLDRDRSRISCQGPVARGGAMDRERSLQEARCGLGLPASDRHIRCG